MISVIIPAFNSENSLEELVDKIIECITKLKLSFEIIIVDDSSKDTTWFKINYLSKKNKFIKGYKFKKNYGQHYAILYGLKKSKGQILITMDDDLQHPPEIIKHLYEKYKEGNQLVYAKPTNKSRGLIRSIMTSNVKFFLKNLLKIKYIDIISDFRLFDREILKKFEELNTSNIYLDSLLCPNAEKINSVLYKEQPRKFGKSTYNLKKLIIYTLNLIISFYNNPMTPEDVEDTN